MVWLHSLVAYKKSHQYGNTAAPVTQVDLDLNQNLSTNLETTFRDSYQSY